MFQRDAHRQDDAEERWLELLGPLTTKLAELMGGSPFAGEHLNVVYRDPLVWHHGWSLTHGHGLAGHDVVSGLHLPLPILWGAFQCDLRARGSPNAS